jgi:Uma2 family endonuclease
MVVASDINTAQDLLDSLGGIPPSRVLMHPAPGAATEADLIAINESKRTLCELVDGVLVEKPMGIREALLAVSLSAMIHAFVKAYKLGFVTGADGLMRLSPGLVRAPDVAFVSWRRVPGGRVPSEPIPNLSPDLAVEILSASNTASEMARKIQEYIDSGTALVWLVDPEKRTTTIYDKDEPGARVYHGSDTIVLSKVLPGFRLAPAELFAELDDQGGLNEEYGKETSR